MKALSERTIAELAPLITGGTGTSPKPSLYRTGDKLTQFFNELGVPLIIGGATRTDAVRNLLVMLNQQPSTLKTLARAIEKAVDMRDYVDNPELLKKIVDRLNLFLAHDEYKLELRGHAYRLTPLVDMPGEDGGTKMDQRIANPKAVFVIHGRNAAARVAVEHFLKSLKLEPIDFDELAADVGGSAFVGDIVREGLKRAQGIVALFTPDEFASLRTDYRGNSHDASTDVQRWQARPNVIFEAGMAYGTDPKRVVLVTLGSEVSLFSDVAGVHILRLDNSPESRGKFRQKLIGMNCDVDQRTNAWTDPGKSGDFVTCVKLSEVSPRDPFRTDAS